MPDPTPSDPQRAPSAARGLFTGLPAPLRVLALVNVALLLAVVAVAFSPRATAQQAGARPAGQYMLVGGRTISGNSNAVYVVDSVNNELVVVRWNAGARRIDGVGYRNLETDLTTTPQR